MRRALGLALLVSVVVGGGACSDDGDGSPRTTVVGDTESTADPNAPTTAAEPVDNPGIDAYCSAVDDYVAKVEAAAGDPDKMRALVPDSESLTAQLQVLLASGLSAEESGRMGDCTQRAVDALAAG